MLVVRGDRVGRVCEQTLLLLEHEPVVTIESGDLKYAGKTVAVAELLKAQGCTVDILPMGVADPATPRHELGLRLQVKR